MSIPKIKLCGFQDETTVRFAAEKGADFIGFVHYPSSPRHVDLVRAELLSRVLDDYCTASVLLLVDPDDSLLNDIAAESNFDYIQLHGDETAVRVKEIKARLRKPIIKAFRIATVHDLEAVEHYNEVCDWFLFDAKAKSGEKGGSGEVFDWTLLAGRQFSKPWMLSGGLNIENIDAALNRLAPNAIDVSSGIEVVRGVKDQAKIEAFIHAVHERS